MSDAAVIKEFLVSLGFKIDAGSERKFTDTIARTTVQVIELGTAVTATASLVVAGVAKIADSLENLYFTSQRTNASAENIQSLGFAARQMGGSVEGAVGSLENLARLLRNSPGGEGLLKNIGIQTRNANGELRDSVDMVHDLGKQFANMPYYKANAYAQALGIDERTLMAMRKGMGEFGEEYKAILHASGMDAQEAAKDAHEFMNQLRLLGATTTILSQKVASEMTGKLSEGIRKLRELITSNFGRITEVLVKVLGFIFKLTDALTIMAMRGIQAIERLATWFSGLSEGSQTLIKWIGLILVAWRVLSAGFLATPLGRVLALASAIALLWDDYQVWKEGGQSLIDWGAWAPAIEAAITGIKTIAGWIHKLLEVTGDWRPVLEAILAYVTGAWALGMISGFGKAVAGMASTLIGGLSSLLGSASLVAAAGMLGYGIGTYISKRFIEGTDLSNTIGRMIAKTLAFFGNKDAAEAVAAEDKANAAAAKNPTRPQVMNRATAPARQTWGTERGLRNNNPGNIEYGKFAQGHGATGVEDQGRFATFGSAQDGLNALADLLRNYVGRGIDSVRKIIAKYAPAGENQTEAYIATVAKRLGVSADQKLDLNDPSKMSGMVDAIVRVENGKNPYSKEMMDKAGGKPTGVAMNQTTNITVTGATDPKTVAHDVTSAQNNVNEQLTRNMRGAVLQ